MVNKDWQPSPDYEVGDVLISCWDSCSYHINLVVVEVNKNASRGDCAYQTLIINIDAHPELSEEVMFKRKGLTKHTAHHNYKRLNERV